MSRQKQAALAFLRRQTGASSPTGLPSWRAFWPTSALGLPGCWTSSRSSAALVEQRWRLVTESPRPKFHSTKKPSRPRINNTPAKQISPSSFFRPVSFISRRVRILSWPFRFRLALFSPAPLNAHQACMELGLHAASFDKVDSALENIHIPWGLFLAGALILTTRPGGTAHFAPQCSSWLWMSRFTSQRNSDDVIGNDARSDVREGNATAMAVPGAQSPQLLSQPQICLEPCHVHHRMISFVSHEKCERPCMMQSQS